MTHIPFLIRTVIVGLVFVQGADWSQASVAAAYDPTDYKVVTTPNGMAQLTVNRAWPTGCEPTEIQVQIAGPDVVIYGTLASAEQPCTKVPQPITIHLNADERVARLSFIDRHESDADERLVDFVLIGLSGQQSRPESGLWWGEDGGLYNTRGPGTAMSLDVQGERVAATINVYHPDGQPVWYFAAGSLDGVIFNAPLHGFAQGQTLTGAYRRPSQAVEVGRLQLEFHAPGRATAWLTADNEDPEIAGLSLQPVSLVRFDFTESKSPERLSGSWVFVSVDAKSREIVLSPPRLLNSAWEYIDLIAGLSLLCPADPQRPKTLPAQCTLSTPEGVILGDFDQVGLDRMSGTDPQGSAIYAFRLDWYSD